MTDRRPSDLSSLAAREAIVEAPKARPEVVGVEVAHECTFALARDFDAESFASFALALDPCPICGARATDDEL